MIETFLHPGHTFNQLACGNCNQLAFSSAEQVAEGSITADPLFIYGARGMGKSHLLNAIGHQVISHNQSTRIIYCSADRFMHTFIKSLKTNQIHEFREYFGSADLLLMDDMQCLAHKERSQQEFLRLYNMLASRQVPIVLACNQPPANLIGFSVELLSRLSGGLVIELLAPDYETKRAIIEKLVVRHRISLGEDVSHFIANIQIKCVRELEGIVIRLGTYSSLQNAAVTLPMAIHYLRDVVVAVDTASDIEAGGELTLVWHGISGLLHTVLYNGCCVSAAVACSGLFRLQITGHQLQHGLSGRFIAIEDFIHFLGNRHLHAKPLGQGIN